MRKLLICFPLLLSAACAAHGERRVVGINQVPPGSTCVQSAALDTFKGQVATTELAAQIMSAARAPKLRWVAHGMMVTMEFNAHRVTVRLDEHSRVISANCG